MTPGKGLRWERAEEHQAEEISGLVRDTVRAVYPRYYLPEIVEAFCRLHGPEAVREDVRRGNVYGLWLDGVLIGTGAMEEDHITRVYVLPEFQGRGFGTLIMERLERAAGERYGAVRLDASLPACEMYERRGYRTVRHDRWPMEGGAVLVYEIMEKSLPGGSEGEENGP